MGCCLLLGVRVINPQTGHRNSGWVLTPSQATPQTWIS